MKVEITKGWFGAQKVRYGCPECSESLTSPLSDVGKTDFCPSCNVQFVVPGSHLLQALEAELDRVAEQARIRAEQERAERDRVAKANAESIREQSNAPVSNRNRNSENHDPISNAKQKKEETSQGYGYVYVMSNPSMPGIVKIGRSIDPNRRGSELQSTGVPTPFKIEYAAMVRDMSKVERELHERFASQRVNRNREFFNLPVDEAVNAVRRYEDSTSVGQSSLEGAASGLVACGIGCAVIAFGFMAFIFILAIIF